MTRMHSDTKSSPRDQIRRRPPYLRTIAFALPLAALIMSATVAADDVRSSRFVQKLAPIHPIGAPLGKELRDQIGSTSVVVIMRDVRLHTFVTYTCTGTWNNYLVLNPWEVKTPPAAGGPYRSTADVDVLGEGGSTPGTSPILATVSEQSSGTVSFGQNPYVHSRTSSGKSSCDLPATSSPAAAQFGLIGSLADAGVRATMEVEWPKVRALDLVIRPKDPLQITLGAIDRSLAQAGLPFAIKPAVALVSNRRDALLASRGQPEPGLLLVEIVQTLYPESGVILLNAEVGLYHRDLWRERHGKRSARPKYGMPEGWLVEPVYRQTFVVNSVPLSLPALVEHQAKLAQATSEFEAALAQAPSPRARQRLREQHERERAKIRKPAVSGSDFAELSWATWSAADNGVLLESYSVIQAAFAEALAADLTFDPP